MTSPSGQRLAIVGLGPGDASLLTIEAKAVLEAAPEVWLRTRRHPAVEGLPHGPRYESFDAVYESEPSFEAVYGAIVDRVLELARRPEGVVYAVPGHPLFGEATVRALMERALADGLATRVVAGISFLDVVGIAIGIDPVAQGALVLDALVLSSSRALVPERPTIIAQVYDRPVATQVKLALLNVYPPAHHVLVVQAAATGEASLRETTIEQLDRADAFDHLTTVYVPPLSRVEDLRSFEGLRAIVANLRSPDGGCPWDLEQTHESLKCFLLEEAYEALDALDEGEPHRIAEELGDLMMQVLLHAQVAEDAGEFAIEDVIGSIAAKLVRRHPHVFGEVVIGGPDDVIRNWEALKQEERGEAPVLDAVPKAMPALAQAQALQSRAEKAGIDIEAPHRDAVRDALDTVAREGGLEAETLGELLFGLVSVARAHDIDAEEALRMAARRFRERADAVESASRSREG